MSRESTGVKYSTLLSLPAGMAAKCDCFSSLMNSGDELFSWFYLVSGVAVPHNQLSILGGTNQEPAQKNTEAFHIFLRYNTQSGSH